MLLGKRRVRLVPAVVSAAVAIGSSYGALSMVAPKIRKQSYQQSLRVYQANLLREYQNLVVAQAGIKSLRKVLASETAAINQIAQVGVPQVDGGSGLAVGGSVPALPTISSPSVGAPITHATTGASALSG